MLDVVIGISAIQPVSVSPLSAYLPLSRDGDSVKPFRQGSNFLPVSIGGDLHGQRLTLQQLHLM
jgi:hypothetical protein